jgi:hypothetical protein
LNVGLYRRLPERKATDDATLARQEADVARSLTATAGPSPRSTATSTAPTGRPTGRCRHEPAHPEQAAVIREVADRLLRGAAAIDHPSHERPARLPDGAKAVASDPAQPSGRWSTGAPRPDREGRCMGADPGPTDVGAGEGGAAGAGEAGSASQASAGGWDRPLRRLWHAAPLATRAGWDQPVRVRWPTRAPGMWPGQHPVRAVGRLGGTCGHHRAGWACP